MVFHRNLRDSKSPPVSRTLLSILADLNNEVVWIVSIHLLISKSSSPFNNPMMTVPRAPITIGIIVTFMFHSFFNSLARSRYLSLSYHYYILIINLSLHFTFFQFYSVVSRDSKVHNFSSSLFFVDHYKVWLSS